MNDIIKNIEAEQMKQTVPEFRVGDTVKVSAKIKEGNRERIQIFEGTVIKRQGGSNRETFTVRKLSNGVGVEKTWPLHSPFVEDIQVVRRGKARRAKLFYLRDRVGKAAKTKENIGARIETKEIVIKGAETEEAPVAEEVATPAVEETKVEAPATEEVKAEEAPKAE